MRAIRVPALQCGHWAFSFKRIPGKGYEAECSDCGIAATGRATAKNAMDAFEKKVPEARAAERREIAKQARRREKAEASEALSSNPEALPKTGGPTS